LVVVYDYAKGGKTPLPEELRLRIRQLESAV